MKVCKNPQGGKYSTLSERSLPQYKIVIYAVTFHPLPDSDFFFIFWQIHPTFNHAENGGILI